jgi:hypothetical protein
MIRTPSVSMEFKRDSIPNKIVFGANIIQKMTLNAAFSTPDVDMATLTKVNDALGGAAQEALGGDHQLNSAMHAAEKTWDTTFGTEGEYVDRVSGEVEDVILSSGYKTTKSETTAGTNPGTPLILIGKANPVAGSLHIEIDLDPGTKNFLTIISTTAVQIVLVDNQFTLASNPGVIAFINDSHRKIDFYNLPSRTDLYVTVIAQNAHGSSLPSAPLALKTL